MEENMTFGEAIEMMKRGKKVARKGWNGKGIYIWLMRACEVPVEWCREPVLKGIAESEGGVVKCGPCARMRAADGTVVTGWLASQTDMFAEDWCVVE